MRDRPRAACEAYEQAFACDPLTAYGGVIALNRPVDRALAEALAEQFVEVLIAPGYDDDGARGAARQEDVRLLELAARRPAPDAGERDAKRVLGGQLVQDRDGVPETRELMRVVTSDAAERGAVARHALRLDASAATSAPTRS